MKLLKLINLNYLNVTIQREALKALSEGRGLGEGNQNKGKCIFLIPSS